MTAPELPEDLKRCLQALRGGGVIACPTETQIGLLADALDPRAVERVRAIKGRSQSETLGLLVPSLDSMLPYLEPPTALARQLVARHWPGPLTLVLRVAASALVVLPSAVLRDGCVALRVPGPSPALTLVRAFGGPLTATSANRTGEPACVTEAELRARFASELDAIARGDAPGGLPSTFLDANGDTPLVLRRGAIEVP